MKIAPHKRMLELNEELKDKIDLNVTGTADCSTALMSLSYGVRYVSIIPGRMEEKGIVSKSGGKWYGMSVSNVLSYYSI